MSCAARTRSIAGEKARRKVEVEFLGVLGKEELASFYALLEKLEAQARHMFKGEGAVPE